MDHECGGKEKPDHRGSHMTPEWLRSCSEGGEGCLVNILSQNCVFKRAHGGMED